MEHIKRAVYTYWTNNGTNLESNFDTYEDMLAVFKQSFDKASMYFDDVCIYTDVDGMTKLTDSGIVANYILIDYSEYSFNPMFWNFPKLITYNMQTEPFVHIDMDFILEEPLTNEFLSSTLVCEMIRPLVQMKATRAFLPDILLEKGNFSPNLICSGLLGGSPEIFKLLFNIAKELVLFNGDVTHSDRFTLEEVALTSLANINNISPYALDTKYTHHQGGIAKHEVNSQTFSIKDVTL